MKSKEVVSTVWSIQVMRGRGYEPELERDVMLLLLVEDDVLLDVVLADESVSDIFQNERNERTT